MRILSVVGARPQFVKLSPVHQALIRRGHEHIIVHTGQHYDHGLSAAFFDEFGLPEPDWNLGVGSGSHGAQTGEMLSRLEAVVVDVRSDWTIVYGDTNSTLAAALAAVKVHARVAHVEAGLRSGNRAMPEEINRVLTDHASDLLLAPTARSMVNLAKEGLGERSQLVGDVMADVLLGLQATGFTGASVPVEVPSTPYLVATLHRAENTDDGARLDGYVAALASLSLPVLLFAHPRLESRAQAFGIRLKQGSLRPCPPIGYQAMMATVARSEGVLTDSGGLQKEAYILGKRCVTLRTETEWSETLEDGANVLAPSPESVAGALDLDASVPKPSAAFGDGHAADRIIDQLEEPNFT